MNAVMVKGDAVGATMYYGAGACSLPTASAVVADIVDVSRLATTDPEHRVPHLAFQPDRLADLAILPISEVESSYYLRVNVIDRAGVLAELTRILASEGISIEALIQKEATEGELVPIILLTHRTLEKHMNEAIRRIESLADIAGSVTRIRVESLDEQD